MEITKHFNSDKFGRKRGETRNRNNTNTKLSKLRENKKKNVQKALQNNNGKQMAKLDQILIKDKNSLEHKQQEHPIKRSQDRN